MKLAEPIKKLCQHRSQCYRDGKWGVFRWEHGASDVKLNGLMKVYCGQHKRNNSPGELARNVRVA